MRRLLIIFTLAVFWPAFASAQKLVIGSRAAQFKPERDLTWISSAAPEKTKWLIDFYSSKNPSCVKFYNNLPSIHKKINGKVAIVIISATDDEQFLLLAARDAGNYFFAIDTQGKAYNAFGIQYVPYSVLLNDQNEILWQGNLSKFESEAIDKIK